MGDRRMRRATDRQFRHRLVTFEFTVVERTVVERTVVERTVVDHGATSHDRAGRRGWHHRRVGPAGHRRRANHAARPSYFCSRSGGPGCSRT
jgi:hypothetical protein